MFQTVDHCEVSSHSFVQASSEAANVICVSSKVFFKATEAFYFSSSWLCLSASCGSAAEGSSDEGLTTLVLAMLWSVSETGDKV